MKVTRNTSLTALKCLTGLKDRMFRGLTLMWASMWHVFWAVFLFSDSQNTV